MTRVASYTELGTAIPLNGGAYAYLHHTFGPLTAFLYSWTAITAIKPGSAAIIAIIFAQYIDRVLFFSLNPNDNTPAWADKLVAVLCVWFIAALNAMGSKWGTIVNNVFTMLKLLALAAVAVIGIVVLGILFGEGSLLQLLVVVRGILVVIGLRDRVRTWENMHWHCIRDYGHMMVQTSNLNAK